MKTTGGRRYYRPDDVELIRLIKDFLYNKRYTIEGVQRLFKEHGAKAFLNGDIQKDFFEDNLSSKEDVPTIVEEKIIEIAKLSVTEREKLTRLKDDLLSIKDTLKSAL